MNADQIAALWAIPGVNQVITRQPTDHLNCLTNYALKLKSKQTSNLDDRNKKQDELAKEKKLLTEIEGQIANLKARRQSTNARLLRSKPRLSRLRRCLISAP
mmetsp:Transcript_16857/g.33989  ORF Transcript_16857/g.33989 Transcript_16857/m.33989 type:complete len:102 (-) Transcript_16857:22-327(-)